MNPHQMAAELVMCPRCGSVRGNWCHTKAGNRSSLIHSDRLRPILEAYGEGYEDGSNGILDALIDSEPWLTAMVNRRERRRDQ